MVGGKVAIMNDGRVEQVGSWEQVLRTPSSAFVADFMGFNILHGALASIYDGFAVAKVNGQAILGIGDGLRIGEPVIVVVSPQSISLSLERDIRRPRWRHCNCNVFEGSITGMRRIGPVAQVSINVGFPLNLEISSDLFDELHLAVGRNVFVQFRAAEVGFLRA
jgi:ABC-type Fe3+/spermidine/putrescine transport system ATPase subunit